MLRQPERAQGLRQPPELERDLERHPVPRVALEAPDVDAVRDEAVEPAGGDDSRDVAVPEPQLVVAGAERRRLDAHRGLAGVVEEADAPQHSAVLDRHAAVRVADAKIAGAEVLRAR